MSEIKNTNYFKSYDDAAQYVESARQLYRDGVGEYRGRRTPEQELIAEVTSDEARLIVDGAMLGLTAMSGLDVVEHPLDVDEKLIGGHSWSDFRGEFERLLVGFGVMTNRLHRDGENVHSYADLRTEDRMKAASVLFTDFLSHNALRFGIDTAGVQKTEFKTRYTDDGGVEQTRRSFDKDKVTSQRDLDQNMRKRGFATGVAAHPAGKISPEEYIRLRREYPEMDKDEFDRSISFYTNVRDNFENRE